MAIMSVPIKTNEDLRPSRLVKSIWSYVKKSMITIVRIFAVYKPFRFFFSLGIFFFILGVIPGVRYLYYFFNGISDGKIQSLILSSILILMGVQLIIMAFVGDLLSVNRKMLEDVQYRLRKMENKNEDK